MIKRKLRSGYTTGACAAASAKAATQLIIKSFQDNHYKSQVIKSVTITLPYGEKASFIINKSNLNFNKNKVIAMASTIKFAGDDPDVTNGAEIVAEVSLNPQDLRIPSKSMISLNAPMRTSTKINIKGGKGVGIATKPGLPVKVGFPAINPVPKQMIKDSVIEAFLRNGFHLDEIPDVTVTISVTNGEKIATKTLNSRLGIIGGISILGTTGIVKPLSSEAWTATITACMDVAKASGCEVVVLSAGRSSEKAHMKKYNFPEEAYVMMGDYIEFAILEAARHQFKGIHLCAQWAKMLKIAMSTPQTHVRYGAINLTKAVGFLSEKKIKISKEHKFNTAREILLYLEGISQHYKAFTEVCKSAKKYAEGIARSVPVTSFLVSYDGVIIASV